MSRHGCDESFSQPWRINNFGTLTVQSHQDVAFVPVLPAYPMVKDNSIALYKQGYSQYHCIATTKLNGISSFSEKIAIFTTKHQHELLMRMFIIITIMSPFLFIGCSMEQSATDKLLDEVEKAIQIDADSASNMLKGISTPDKLTDKTFARWCMLSGKVTDKIFNTILPTYQFERAYDWYSSHGNPEEQVQILIYLGRSNAAEGDYDKAMSIYTNALGIAEKNKLNNLTGYTYCYIGDLYREKFMRTEAIKKYETAAEYFKKENNTDSYACALRDVGREYACMDSLSCALEILTIADSVAINTLNINVTSSINNALGNIYVMQKKYDIAEKYFLKALVGKDKMPDYMALIDLYIAADSINKAKKLLSQVPQNDPKYTYSIKYLYYQLFNKEKNYKEALANLEEYVEITDSIIYADSQSKILDIETKYNHLKISKEVDSLKLKQQSYILILAICIAALLLITTVYLLYRKKTKEKIQRQRDELSKIRTDLLYISLELEKKRRLLDTLKEREEEYNRMREEISLLTTNYQLLQSKSLENSSLLKELACLASQNTPSNGKPLITDKQWKLIANEITHIYPNFRKYIYNLCPDLQESDFMYCCLCMCGFDTNTEAKLLNITVDSVRKKRLRLRKKLGITLSDNNSTIYEYLIENTD